jgi:hypothetical protein
VGQKITKPDEIMKRSVIVCTLLGRSKEKEPDVREMHYSWEGERGAEWIGNPEGKILLGRQK